MQSLTTLAIRHLTDTIDFTMNQTQHLQKVLLVIIKDIDEVCRRHNITYYLFGGSALGARRHKGFIPWDDDLDIALLPEDYERFLTIAKKDLDPKRYYIQEGRIDWPEDFSKIKLIGTHIREYGEYYVDSNSDGIFLDVFRLDYAPVSKSKRFLQYIFGKLILIDNLKKKGYSANSVAKKILLGLSSIMDGRLIKNWRYNQYYKYNAHPSNWLSRVLGETRFKSAFLPREVFGIPVYVPFEDIMLPVPEKLDEYLSITYGDYMKLPPEDKRVGLHITEIDFGNY